MVQIIDSGLKKQSGSYTWFKKVNFVSIRSGPGLGRTFILTKMKAPVENIAPAKSLVYHGPGEYSKYK